MAPRRSRLTISQEERVVAVCEAGPEGLKRILNRLAEHDLLLNVESIRQLIVDEVGEANGDLIATFLFQIAVGHRRDANLPATELKNISAMVEQRKARTLVLERWVDCIGLFEDLLSSRSVRAATKALSVSYDFERVYIDGRFLTSLRPIFDSNRDDIIGAVIVQTLRLEFTTPEGGRSTISLALDKADLIQLREACERAIRKADATLNKTSQAWSLPTFIPGGGEAKS